MIGEGGGESVPVSRQLRALRWMFEDKGARDLRERLPAHNPARYREGGRQRVHQAALNGAPINSETAFLDVTGPEYGVAQ